MSTNDNAPVGPVMRAKLLVVSVMTPEFHAGYEQLKMIAVSDSRFDTEGNAEDSSFSKWSPSAEFAITIANPALFGKFKPGQKFYVDFTEATEPAAVVTEPAAQEESLPDDPNKDTGQLLVVIDAPPVVEAEARVVVPDAVPEAETLLEAPLEQAAPTPEVAPDAPVEQATVTHTFVDGSNLTEAPAPEADKAVASETISFNNPPDEFPVEAPPVSEQTGPAEGSEAAS